MRHRGSECEGDFNLNAGLVQNCEQAVQCRHVGQAEQADCVRAGRHGTEMTVEQVLSKPRASGLCFDHEESGWSERCTDQTLQTLAW